MAKENEKREGGAHIRSSWSPMFDGVFPKLHYRDWMDLLEQIRRTSVLYDIRKWNHNPKHKNYVRLGVWSLYPAYLTQDVSHYLVVICVLLILYSFSCLISKNIPKGLKTPLWHIHRHLQSLLLSVKQYLFMCVTEQQATTNQCSAAIQQCAWFIHFANTRLNFG